MNRSHLTVMAALAAVAVLVTVTGCGISLQSTAEPLPSNVIPSPLRVPTPSPSPPPSSASPSPQASVSAEPTAARLRLWFVQEDGLAAVESDLPVGSSADLVVQALAVAPTTGPAADGLRTVAADPLTGLPLVTVAAPLPSPAPTPAGVPSGSSTAPPPILPPLASVTVILNPAFSALPPVEQVLLLGQVVLSLTGSGQESVSFSTEAGGPVAVPLPDGRLLDVPATARDYASLIVRP